MSTENKWLLISGKEREIQWEILGSTAKQQFASLFYETMIGVDGLQAPELTNKK